MGITLYEVRNVVIRDLIVQGFQLDGINAHDGVFDALLKKVTCRGNARSGICVGGASRVRNRRMPGRRQRRGPAADRRLFAHPPRQQPPVERHGAAAKSEDDSG